MRHQPHCFPAAGSLRLAPRGPFDDLRIPVRRALPANRFSPLRRVRQQRQLAPTPPAPPSSTACTFSATPHLSAIMACRWFWCASALHCLCRCTSNCSNIRTPGSAPRSAETILAQRIQRAPRPAARPFYAWHHEARTRAAISEPQTRFPTRQQPLTSNNG